MRNLSLTIAGILLSTMAFAGKQGMPSMPTLQPKKVYAVKGDEDFDSKKGFGEEASMTRMMNLMMVEGSGFEGMDMDAMKVADNAAAPHTASSTNSHAGHSMSGMAKEETSKPDSTYQVDIISGQGAKVGSNAIEFSVKENGKELKGLKLKAQVFMTSMDMGTEEPKVKEISAGKYQVKAPFTMKGPWAIKIIFPDNKEKILNFDVNSK